MINAPDLNERPSELVARENKQRCSLYEMRGFLSSALGRDGDAYERWVLEEIQKMIDEALGLKGTIIHD